MKNCIKILKPKVFVVYRLDPGLPYKSHQISNSTKEIRFHVGYCFNKSYILNMKGNPSC